MSAPAQTYAAVTKAVDELIRRLPAENDPARVAYMVARAAAAQLVELRGRRGATRAIYDLGREFLLSGVTPTPDDVFPDLYPLRLRDSIKPRATARRRGTALERALRRILVDEQTGCWVWTGSLLRSGYGSIGSDHPGRQAVVHRVVYEAAKGPIHDGLVLDHLCRNRPCCNPAHLEPVTELVNIRRGDGGKHWAERTHCPSGHLYSAGNTYRYSWGRVCKTCARNKYAAHGRIGEPIRRRVFFRDGGICQYCSARVSEAKYHVDHDVPVVRGGSHEISNLVCACPNCNHRKGRKTGQEFRAQLADEFATDRSI